MQVLAVGLGANTSLQHLDLAENDITCEGAGFLADLLRQSSILTNLNLRGNSIGPQGAAMVGDALLGNSGLTSLDIAGRDDHRKYNMQNKKSRVVVVFL